MPNAISNGNSELNPQLLTDIENGVSSAKAQKGIRKDTIVVIGTGDFGRAIVSCLIRAGYRVVVGSRNPQKNRSRIQSIGGEIAPLSTAISQSHIIINAIPYEGFASLRNIGLRGKILVDVSNRPLEYKNTEESLAVKLQNLVPEASVVKAFNTLSAYALQRGLVQGGKEVQICSNDDEAKAQIISLVRNLGFTPVDFGSLSNAKTIEELPFHFFSEWKFPGVFACIIWVFTFLIALFRSQLCPNFNSNKWEWNLFSDIPMGDVQKACACTSLTLLAACYFPGVLAAYIQLYRRTKYSEFPNWLDVWLKGRKGLGLLALFFVTIHAIMAIILHMSYGNSGVWHETLFFMCGIVAFVLMGTLGVTSLPSVSASLTWREFSFVQRYLGWPCLFLGTFHVIFFNWGFLFENRFQCVFIPDTSQIFIMFPLLTIILKLPLLLPCVNSRIEKIRRGYEEVKQNPQVY